MDAEKRNALIEQAVHDLAVQYAIMKVQTESKASGCYGDFKFAFEWYLKALGCAEKCYSELTPEQKNSLLNDQR